MSREGTMVYDDVPLTKRAILEEAKTFDLEIVTKLSCTNGRITRIASLETCKNLTELNLSGNCILEIEGLANLVKLKKLILTSNRIESLENIDQIPSLQHLLIQDNRIASFEDFKQLKNLPNLQSVYLQNHGGDLPNPICRDRRYKAQVGFASFFVPFSPALSLSLVLTAKPPPFSSNNQTESLYTRC